MDIRIKASLEFSVTESGLVVIAREEEVPGGSTPSGLLGQTAI